MAAGRPAVKGDGSGTLSDLSGYEQHLAARVPLLGHRLRFARRREGHLRGDRDDDLALGHEGGVPREHGRVRVGHERVYDEAALPGAGRFTEDGPDDSAWLELAVELLDRLAVDGVGDRVQHGQLRDVRVVVERDDTIDAELACFRLLRRANAGPHLRAARLRGEHGDASDTPQGASHEDHVALGRIHRVLDELRTRQEDERQGAGFHDVETGRDLRPGARGRRDELLVGPHHQAEYAIADGERRDALAHLYDLARDVAPEDDRELDRMATLRRSAP